uniref:conjugal transfer protein TraB n=1 Tax=Streptomyces sp. SAT1 TaxID=1849967 RepID=UPI0007F9AC27|nr:conjugal transfer protein TraB [Streptomyces sp. SAT1]ANO42807.1 conjugal transfer protein TraB [Streptomyces sp. SAT1]
MSDLVSRSGSAVPAVADADNRYKAVQAKLNKLGEALEDSTLELESLRRSMQNLAQHTDSVVTDIENASLDPKFVSLTAHVATALTGAAREVRTLCDHAPETADLTHETRRLHATRYRALDDIRSNRREKTPKPGFFNR